jgi:lipase chaperone LimK
VRRLVAAGSVALVACAALLWRRDEPPRRLAGRHAGSVEARTASGASGAVVPPPTGAPSASPRPRSLRGTRVDGGLAVDGAGRFVPTRDARRLFDHFLSATGEEAPERTRERIVAAIGRRGAPAAAADAVALLDRYLAYRDRARDLVDGPAASDSAARLAALHALRRAVFGEAAAAALFGDEEAAQRAALERRRIEEDATLAPEDRAARLAALDAALPEDVRRVREAAVTPLRLLAEEARAREAGASADELRAMREQAVGPAAADRLAVLDAERAAWDARVADYRAARTAVEADPGLDAAGRAAAVAALLHARFTAPERLRVEALDRIAGREGR